MEDENIWDKLPFELIDRIISATSFNDEQIKLISNGLDGCSKVLDLCTGFGNLARALVSCGKIVYGLDIRTESLAYAKRKVGTGLEGEFFTVKSDVSDLNYSGRFDGVSCASSFGFPDLNQITRRIYNALCPAGKFAVSGFEGIGYLELMRDELVYRS